MASIISRQFLDITHDVASTFIRPPARPYPEDAPKAVAAVRASLRAGTCAPGAVCGGGCHFHRSEPGYGLVQARPYSCPLFHFSAQPEPFCRQRFVTETTQLIS